MGNLYLVDKATAENALALAALDSDSVVVLIQDGVYAPPERLAALKGRVYAVKQDLEQRGLGGVEWATAIDYGDLVALVFQNKVLNFA
ncbi:MAG: hypothetical protein HYU86_03485 [Chloroflexi bacterium]|nr:hypothetical protein [Chloroflexota bacterium]